MPGRHAEFDSAAIGMGKLPHVSRYASRKGSPHDERLQSKSLGVGLSVSRGFHPEVIEHWQRFDTVLCLNVLEHVRGPLAALRNMLSALRPGGRLILYVPAGQWLYSSLDEALSHRYRYSREMLQKELQHTGFELEHISGFNRLSVPGW